MLFRSDIIKLDFGLNKYTFKLFDIDFNININIKKSLILNYHGDFNILDFFSGINEINIDININDIKLLDYIKIISIIQHELTHVYELLIFKVDTSKSSFNKIPIINRIKVDQSNNMFDFTNRLYYSLEHELNATVSMIQSYLSRFDDKSINNLENILNNYQPYKNLIYLKSFNYKDFINKFTDKNELLFITNIINKEFNYKLIKITELERYYKKWNDFFKTVADKYIKKAIKILKEISTINESFNYHCYNDISLYDDYSYKEYINSNYKELIGELFNKIKKQEL